MKRNARNTWIALAMAVSLLTAASAWGQYGLYGSPTTPSYSTQQVATPSTQQTVVYQAPTQPQTAAGPNLIAPTNQVAANGVNPSYGQQVATQTTPNYLQYAQPSMATASMPAYPSYQPTTPAYPSYSSPTATANYQRYPSYASPSYQAPATQSQYPMYRTPTSPQFGSQPAATQVPRPQPTQLTPTPQPMTEPTSLYDGSPCNETTCTEACGEDCCEPCCEPCCPWYVSVSGLAMGRDLGNRVWTSYQANQEANQIMNTQFEMSWAAGAEITFGRSFCCGTYGIEATYWQLAKMTGSASITNPAGVSTPLDMRYVLVGAGDNMSDLFDNALEHRLNRTNEAYNVELNTVYYGQPGQAFYGHTINWLIGARFLKFDDDLLFSSLEQGTWGGSGGIYEGYLGDKVENYLVGVQVGFQARGPQWNRFSTFLSTKFGVYNNHIKNDFQLYRGDGANAYTDPTSGITATYPVRSTANVFSTVAEINLGIEWNLSPRFSAGVGYRLIAISGIGLADNQIPFYIVDVPEIERIDCNGDLLLHGAFVTASYGF